jgi:hypothetical protein
MIKLINKTTGTPMWVADERVNEYLEAGHKPASEVHAKMPKEEPEVESKEEKVSEPKKAVKKTSKKK